MQSRVTEPSSRVGRMRGSPTLPPRTHASAYPRHTTAYQSIGAAVSRSNGDASKNVVSYATSAAATAAAAMLIAYPLQASELQSLSLVHHPSPLLTAAPSQKTAAEACSAVPASWHDSGSSRQLAARFDLESAASSGILTGTHDLSSSIVLADLNPLTWFKEKPPPPPPSPFDFLPRIGSPFEVQSLNLQLLNCSQGSAAFTAFMNDCMIC